MLCRTTRNDYDPLYKQKAMIGQHTPLMHSQRADCMVEYLIQGY